MKFEFECSDGFVILSDCIVFCGKVINGTVAKGESIRINTEKYSINGKVDTILDESTNEFIESAIPDTLVRIGINQLTPKEINDILFLDVSIEPEEQPSLLEMLGVKYPFSIYGEVNTA